jgi:hypothetical protein
MPFPFSAISRIAFMRALTLSEIERLAAVLTTPPEAILTLGPGPASFILSAQAFMQLAQCSVPQLGQRKFATFVLQVEHGPGGFLLKKSKMPIGPHVVKFGFYPAGWWELLHPSPCDVNDLASLVGT